MVLVASILVDFDGTACTRDVGEVLLERFGEPSWREYDEAVDRGEMGLREAMHIQAGMLPFSRAGMLTGSRDEMLAYAVDRCPLDPTFPAFVSWAEEQELPLAIVSDGFGFYIPPILEAAGLGYLDVITNELVFEGDRPELRHPAANPRCVGCGTCKMQAALAFRERHGPVAFIGEGQSDRYGALYSDVVFAKDELVEIAGADGVPFVPWKDFEDVRRELESGPAFPGPRDPDPCPGWIPA